MKGYFKFLLIIASIVLIVLVGINFALTGMEAKEVTKGIIVVTSFFSVVEGLPLYLIYKFRNK